MRNEPTTHCTLHVWERRLEVHNGAECVVRVCLNCRQTELVWCRRGIRLEWDDCTTRKGRRIGRRFADNPAN
jgi:hypothetical protein